MRRFTDIVVTAHLDDETPAGVETLMTATEGVSVVGHAYQTTIKQAISIAHNYLRNGVHDMPVSSVSLQCERFDHRRDVDYQIGATVIFETYELDQRIVQAAVNHALDRGRYEVVRAETFIFPTRPDDPDYRRATA